MPFAVLPSAGIHNDGPSAAVFDVTLTLILPSGCSGTTTPKVVQNQSLASGGNLNLSPGGWTVTCAPAGSYGFTVNVSVSVDPPVVDPDLSNNAGSGSSTTQVN